MPGRGCQVQLGVDDALAGGQCLGGEEAGAAVAHGQQRLAVHRASKLKRNSHVSP